MLKKLSNKIKKVLFSRRGPAGRRSARPRLKNLKLGFFALIVIALLTFAIGLAVRGNLARANSLVGFNEGYGSNVHDSKGTATGAITSAVWKSQDECLLGSCLYFNGTSLVNFGNTYNASGDMTLELWFKTIPIASGSRTLLAKGTGTDPKYRVYMSSDGKLNFYINDATNNNAATTTSRYDDNKWHYLSAVKSGTSEIDVYVDAILAAKNTSLTATGTLVNSDTFYLGIDGDGSSNGWLGYIDELKIMTATAQSAAQIKTDYVKMTSDNGVAMKIGPDLSNLTQGLIGWWRMNESSGTLADSSGNSNTGTWYGTGASHYTTGKFGNGGGFNNTDDYVDAGTSDTLNLTGDLTISAWIKPTSYGQSGYGRIVSRRTATLGYEFSLGATKEIRFSASGGATVLTNSNVITYGQWQHVVVSKTGANTTIYLNGQSVGTGSMPTIASNPANTFYIGNYYSHDRTFDGTIDDVRVYSRALSPAEVQQLYAWAPGPVAYWNMDEGTGGFANDSSGNNSQGTWYGTGNHWAAGKYGETGMFNGSSDYISAGTNSVLNITGPITIESWIKARSATTTGGNAPRIVARTTTASGTHPGYFMVLDTAQKINFGVSGDTQALTSSTVSLNAWHHVTGIYDGTNVSIYIDGIKQATGAGSRYTTAASLLIGSENTLNGFFDGSIDDVKIYNYARTPKQITQDMLGNQPAVSPGAPQVYWKFDEGQGTSANDSSGNFNTGSITSGAWNMSGKFGKALTFTASTAVAKTLAIDPAYSNTISVWVYPTTSIASKTIVTNLTTSSASKPVYGNCTGATLALNTWTHIIAQSDGASICKIYQNGVQTASSTVGVTFGTTLNLGATSFVGSMDEFKFYYYPLTSDEVKVDYNQGLAVSFGSGPDSKWWLAGGIDPASVIAVYQPIGAASYAASKVNLSSPGTNDATDGTAYPTWDAVNGWTFATQYLNTNIPTNANISSVIVRFTNAAGQAMFGVADQFEVWPSYGGNGVYYAVPGGSHQTISPSLTSGVLALTKSYGYRNGVVDTTLMSGGTLSITPYIGARNQGSTAQFYWSGKMQAMAFYNTILTSAQVATITTAMNRLPNNYAPSNSYTSSFCVPGGAGYCAAPVVEWKFEEANGGNALDTSGHGATGTATGTTVAIGKVGNARQFTASDTITATITDPAYANTLEAWVYPTGSIASKTIITNLTTNSSSQPVYGGCTGTALPLNTWTYISAVSTDSTHCTLYQNGVAVTGATGVTFGTTLAMGVTSFTGKLDEVKIFNYPRSADQIAYDYNRGLPLAWWKFNEASGTTANDSSGNFFTGTITAANFVPGRINNGLSFNGSTAFVSAAVNKSINTVSFWMIQNNTSNKSILDLGGGYTVIVTSNAIATTGFATPTIYVDGIARSAITDTNWHLVTITTATPFTAGTVTIGKVGANFFAGMLDDLRLYSYALTSAQNKVLFNEGSSIKIKSPTAVAYLLNDQFSDVPDVAAGAVNGTYANPTGGLRTVVDTNNKLSITGEIYQSPLVETLMVTQEFGIHQQQEQ